jgi:hypothetical protein
VKIGGKMCKEKQTSFISIFELNGTEIVLQFKRMHLWIIEQQFWKSKTEELNKRER